MSADSVFTFAPQDSTEYVRVTAEGHLFVRRGSEMSNTGHHLTLPLSLDTELVLLMLAEKIKELQAAQARAEANERDAGRYRFFTAHLNPILFCQYMGWHPKELRPNIDAAIDAAIEAEKKEK